MVVLALFLLFSRWPQRGPLVVSCCLLVVVVVLVGSGGCGRPGDWVVLVGVIVVAGLVVGLSCRCDALSLLANLRRLFPTVWVRSPNPNF